MHNASNAFTCSYGEHAHAVLHRLNIFCSEQSVFVLVTHVLDLNIMECAPLLSSVQCIAGIFGVNMYLDNILYHSNNHRIAQTLQRFAHGLFINAGTLNNELRTIGVFQIQGLHTQLHASSTRSNLQHLAIVPSQAR